MRWNVMLGTIVAIGTLAATQAPAQQSAAGSEANATPGRQDDAAANAPDAYGAYVAGPSTPDADGVPVAKPNPMAHFEKEEKQSGDDNVPVETPLVSDPRTDGSAGDPQTK
jgi:hypothetical protein